MANKKITQLTAATTLNDGDLIPCVSGIGTTPVTQKISIASMRTVIGTGNTVITVASNDFTPQPLANNVITFSDTVTSGIQAGDVCSFAQNGFTQYYLVTQVSVNTSVTFAGPPISTAFSIGDITIYSKSRSVQTDIVFSGAYAINGTTNTLINRETRSRFRWNGAKAYLLFVAARNNEEDGGTDAEINVSIAKLASLSTRNNMLTYSSGGLVLAGTGWNTSTNNLIAQHYVVEFGDEIEIALVDAGGNGDARDLTVQLVFGLEF